MPDRARDLLARLKSPRVRPVVLVTVVLCLLVGSAAAFAVAERLKLERSPVASPKIQRILGPTCDCPKDTAALSFGLRHSDLVTASIVDANGRRIRLLLDNEPRRRGRVNLTWDGRNDAGTVVHDGRYRLRVALGQAHRTITIPTPVRVDTRPPRLRLISADPNVFSPDGDGKADRVLYRYRSSELGRVAVFADEQLVSRARRPGGVAQVRWRGRIAGEVAAPGTYSTWLTFTDAAGNESRPTRTVLVTIRFVQLHAPVTVPRRGTLVFEIDADAADVAWSLRGPSGGIRLRGTSPPGTVRVKLPPRITRGTYTLVASIASGTAEAQVRVTKAAGSGVSSVVEQMIGGNGLETDDPEVLAGADLFATVGCLDCHTYGDQGTAGPGPNLSAIGDTGRTADYWTEWIRDPRSKKPSTVMPAFPRLTDEELLQLAAFLVASRST